MLSGALWGVEFGRQEGGGKEEKKKDRMSETGGGVSHGELGPQSDASSAGWSGEEERRLRFEREEEDSLSRAPEPRRGRARSSSVASEAELDADIAASQGKAYSHLLRGAQPAVPRSTTPTGRNARANVWQTINDLEGADYPGGKIPYESTSPSKLEEEKAERELDELEKRVKNQNRQRRKGRGAKKEKGKRKTDQTMETEEEIERRFDYEIKVLLLGDGGVGKTSLMRQYMTKSFQPNLLSTAGWVTDDKSSL